MMTFEDTIKKQIADEIVDRVAACREEVVKSAVAEFDRQVRQEIGHASVAIANYFSVERVGPNLVITIRIEKE